MLSDQSDHTVCFKRTQNMVDQFEDLVQLLFICRTTNYFSKNYFNNFAKYMMSLFFDIARESSELIYKKIKLE